MREDNLCDFGLPWFLENMGVSKNGPPTPFMASLIEHVMTNHRTLGFSAKFSDRASFTQQIKGFGPDSYQWWTR